jgi:hypothetical protein
MDIRPGLALATAIVVVLLLVIAAVDLYLEVRHQRILGQYMRRWASAYPLFSGFLVILLGAMLGHFFWH